MREEERGSRDPVSSEEIFRSVNRRRASLAMAKSKKADTSKISIANMGPVGSY